MKLSTGKIAFPIEFDNGEKDAIYFNPNDPNLSIRLADFQKNIETNAREFEKAGLNANGEPDDMGLIDRFREFQDILYKELDTAFGGDISAVIFKYCSPFAIVGGEYFIIQFIEAIKPEVEKHVQKANADMQKKMSKHIGKYTK